MKLTRLIGLARPYRASLALAAGLMAVETGFALGLPWLGGRLASSILTDQRFNIDAVLGGIIGLFAVRSVFAHLRGRLLVETSASIVTDMRQKIYDKIQSLPLGYFRGRRQGDILSFAVYEAEQVSSFMTGTVTSVLPNLLAVVGAVTLMAVIDSALAGIVLALVPLFYIGLRLIGRGLRPLSIEVRDAYAALVSTVDENISMMPAIKAFGREHAASTDHKTRAELLRTLICKQGRINSFLTPFIQFCALTAVVLLLRFLSERVNGGELSVAEFVSFLLYAAFLTAPFASLADLWAQTQLARIMHEVLVRVA